jgi:ATP-dependent DNA helicase DinG
MFYMDAHDLTPQECALIERIYDHLQSTGLRHRQSQRDMTLEVARSLALGTPSLIEAPTGTGKSLAYLIGGGVLASTRDRRLIVSTAGTGLQDQLIHKDVPTVAAAFEQFGVTLPSAVLKGRGRYVCPTRLRQVSGQRSMFDEDGLSAALGAVRKAFDGGWSGCRDHLPSPPAYPVWSLVQNDRNLCEGKNCGDYDDCPYYRSIEQAIAARVVITNHDYLMTTLSTAQQGVMCDFERNIYVFDEGHHLGEHIIDSFREQIVASADDAREISRTIGSLDSASKPAADMAAERVTGLCKAINQAAFNMTHDGQTQYRFPRGEIPGGLLRLLTQWRDAMNALLEMLRPLATAQRQSRASREGLSIKLRLDFSRLESAVKTLHSITTPSASRAAWLNLSGSVWTVCVSPFDASSIARDKLWSKMHGAVITSATLASLGRFEHVVRELGLPDQTRTMRLQGVFDYERNARILVPKSFPEPTDPQYVPRLVEMLRRGVIRSSHRGVLVYFTSRATMEDVYRRLLETERACVLAQGLHGAVHAIVSLHKERIARGEKSVIFGLDGFSEGVDLPGDLCTRVVITKLPFQQIDDPVLKTHSEALEAAGLSAFNLLTLPRAGTKLSQLCGRLLRTETDHGDILVPDVRLVRKRYGAQLLRGVPIRHQVV